MYCFFSLSIAASVDVIFAVGCCIVAAGIFVCGFWLEFFWFCHCDAAKTRLMYHEVYFGVCFMFFFLLLRLLPLLLFQTLIMESFLFFFVSSNEISRDLLAGKTLIVDRYAFSGVAFTAAKVICDL